MMLGVTMAEHTESFDVIVVGAGPAGLSCAIEARTAGLSVVVLEQGSLVDAIRRFPTNLVWFSTPELLEIGGVPFSIPSVRPTRVDVLNYYRTVTLHHGLDIRHYDAVAEVRRSEAAFEVISNSNKRYRAKYVVVATGYFDRPNRLDVAGETLPNVLHYYNEPFGFAGCAVTVVGGRNSAVEAALDLYRHGARVTLVHRGTKLSEGVKYWILPDIENRLKNGQITGLFNATVDEIHERSVIVKTSAGRQEVPHEFVFVLVGFLPDVDHLRAWGVGIDPDSLAPEHDEKTFETNVSGLFVAGSVAAGRNTNKIFVENGRLHGKAIIDAILLRRGARKC